MFWLEVLAVSNRIRLLLSRFQATFFSWVFMLYLRHFVHIHRVQHQRKKCYVVRFHAPHSTEYLVKSHALCSRFLFFLLSRFLCSFCLFSSSFSRFLFFLSRVCSISQRLIQILHIVHLLNGGSSPRIES